ncbi:hypothetical protein SARC_16363, partial [Sphaeroforma arctica JP610]
MDLSMFDIESEGDMSGYESENGDGGESADEDEDEDDEEGPET